MNCTLVLKSTIFQAIVKDTQCVTKPKQHLLCLKSFLEEYVCYNYVKRKLMNLSGTVQKKAHFLIQSSYKNPYKMNKKLTRFFFFNFHKNKLYK